MRRLEADPLKYLVERFNTAPASKEKDGLALELLPYAYPKLKAVDVELSGTQDINITIGGKTLPTGGESGGN
jgi:hypothetical protein